MTDTKITFSKSDFPIGAALTCGLLKQEFDIGEKTCLKIDDHLTFTKSHSISRYIARLYPDAGLYPSNILSRTEVDNWLTLTGGPAAIKSSLECFVSELNNALQTNPFLVGKCITIADFEAFGVILKNQQVLDNSTPLSAWFDRVEKRVEKLLKNFPVPESKRMKTNIGKKRDEGGKFASLPGAEKGKIVVRFPPEASGYLHIGHAKAALLNQYYQQEFEGKLIMRFDDTNPAKEDGEFEKVILQDLKLLEIKPDLFTHTSDLFPKMLDLCENLIKSVLAFADDTDGETMKKEREDRKCSKNRDNSVETNLKMWEDMKSGTDSGQKWCIRAKMDMSSPNGCLRDPTIYRCKNECHVRTGSKYKAYPTYDFACPIVDSVEGVTHALRTTEYHDRDDQYNWFIEKLNLRPVVIYDYSRLNMNNTVLSKRKLAWFVQQGLVDGWDDPRFPTVRGILRRGMTVEGLKEFIISQGSSRSVVNMEWDKIWSFNRKIIDRDSCRYTALEGDLVPVTVTNAKVESKDAQKHPKDPSMGTKKVWMGPKVYIEAVDAVLLKEEENATFINWGNLLIKKVTKQGDRITSVEAETNLSNTDFKKTQKLTWLAETDKAPWTNIICVYFEHLITKSVLSKEEDFKQFIGRDTRREVPMIGDDDLKCLQAGETIQLQRKGFFRIDECYQSEPSTNSKQIVAFYIPDGHVKAQAATSKVSESSVGNSVTKKGSSGDPSKVHINMKSDNVDIINLNLKIRAQGDTIRNLKSSKADKSVIKSEVDILLVLKSEFKKSSGVEWTPDFEDKSSTKDATTGLHNVQVGSLSDNIKCQGDKIRNLKTSKAEKSLIKSEVDILLALKSEFKKSAGFEWTLDSEVKLPSKNSPASPSSIVELSDNTKITNISDKIKLHGDKIRNLKTLKAEKSVIKSEVDILLALKSEFKKTAGTDWTPEFEAKSCTIDSKAEPPSVLLDNITSDNLQLCLGNKIKSQGDKIRNLKTSKAEKSVIKCEVDVLLSLKSEFKKSMGHEWTPDYEAKLPSVDCSTGHIRTVDVPENMNVINLSNKIKIQGDEIRNLKTSKAEKSVIKAKVDTLLALKADFKKLANVEWTPEFVHSSNKASIAESTKVINISSNSNIVHEKIKCQGDKIRTLKASKAEKSVIKSEVDTLLALKSEFKQLSGVEWTPNYKIDSPSKVSHVEVSEKAGKNVKNKINKESDTQRKKQTRLCLEAKKLENLPEWYSQVITKAEMIKYYNVSGCYILRPWAYSIWDKIKSFIDEEIAKMGVENCYFPLFVSKAALEKEKDHIEGFSPEVAWVTKAGSTDLAEPIAIRPTSETIIYPAVAEWIESYRDLPLKLNQWSNVIRWEFKQPTPFLRTREFLWQEGHTAFATEKEALEDLYAALDIYARVYEELLAVPVVRGRKTKKESFAGGVFTTTVEAFVSANGRAIQAATSHHLGQNFSKMCDITFEDPETKELQYVYQNSWGLTTRAIGVMIMVHGDDKGLVLPPRIAKIQVVIVPVGITAKTTAEEKQKLTDFCRDLAKEFSSDGIRSYCDDRDNVTPGWKFNHWELKGVPMRIELGPKEMTSETVCVARRDTGEKLTFSRKSISSDVTNLIDTIHNNMFDKAKTERDYKTIKTTDWQEFVSSLDEKKIIRAPFCGDEQCETSIKQDSSSEEAVESGAPSMGAKALCIPFEQTDSVEGLKCIYPSCSRTPKFFTSFGRSY